MLNMDLAPVRVVLANEVNRILVCEDRRRATGALYTDVAVTDPGMRRTAAALAASGAFSANGEYVGSATQGEALHRRAMAQSLLAACAETQLPAAAAMLLLNGRCVNLDASGEVYFNYFLDFADYRESTTQAEYCQAVAERVFDLLSREWARSTGGQLPQYPRELVAFFKKAQVGGFSTIGAILTAVRAMPDRPQPPHRGARLLWDKVLAGAAFVRRHSMAIFLAALVCVTVAYAAYQIGMRMFAGSAAQENTFYGGVQQIGEVSLTDENE